MGPWGHEIPLSRKDRRTISDFFAQEMLYDYLTERLDDERRKALDERLSQNRELKKELDKISQGQRYAQSLKHLHVPTAALEAIDEPETYMSVLLKKTNYERWPLTVKWGIEAMVILSALMIILIVMPWEQALKFGLSPRGREVILAEVNRPAKDESMAMEFPVESQTPEFEDEGAKKPTTVNETPIGKVPEPAALPPTSVAVKPAPPAPTPPPAKPAEPAVAAGDLPAELDPSTDVTADDKSKKPGEGALFRGNLAVTNLPMTGPKIREKIIELGGRKAGEVDLGWKKTPTSAYYHFTMPEAKYEELLEFLGEYGEAKVGKEKHPRVMPDGIIRLILTVEEAKK